MPNCGCAIPDEAFLGLEDEDEQDEETRERVQRCAKET
jgi:hypothetical protein